MIQIDTVKLDDVGMFFRTMKPPGYVPAAQDPRGCSSCNGHLHCGGLALVHECRGEVFVKNQGTQ